MSDWRLVVDVGRCHDCNNCFLACKDEFVGNDWPPYSAAQPVHGQRWMNIHRREKGQYPLVEVAYLPKPCLHCREAPCLESSPNGAVYRRDDGIVIIDPQKARGRKELALSCPFGAIFWNEELQLPQKCTLCAHLLDDGWTEPRCVQVCPTGALTFIKGEPSDLEKMAQAEGWEAFRPDLNTRPRVLFKNLSRFNKGFVAGSVAFRGSGECAEGVTVRLLDTDNREIGRAVTDNYGDFKFPDLAEDGSTYKIMVFGPGEVQAGVEVTMDRSRNTGVIFL